MCRRLTPVANGDAIRTAAAARRSVARWKDERLALLQGYDFTARLYARALLDEQVLAAREVSATPAERARHLEREGERAVEILMQAVVPADRVAQEERCRPPLPLGRAAREVVVERGGIALRPSALTQRFAIGARWT
jgi:hypothetical protein